MVDAPIVMCLLVELGLEWMDRLFGTLKVEKANECCEGKNEGFKIILQAREARQMRSSERY